MMWMDLLDGCEMPRRGDRLRTTKTLYYVLTSRMVKRKDPQAVPRCSMRVLKVEEMDEQLRNRLLRSAVRRGSSRLFSFRWYPREKKRVTFEQHMRRQRA